MQGKPQVQKRQVKSGRGYSDVKKFPRRTVPPVVSRRGNQQVDDTRFFKVWTGLVAVLLSLGIFVSIWFVWQVNNSLADLAREQSSVLEEQKANQDLASERDRLSSREEVEKKGAVLGLFPPGKKQTRRP